MTQEQDERQQRKIAANALLRAIKEKARRMDVPELKLINDVKQAVWQMKDV